MEIYINYVSEIREELTEYPYDTDDLFVVTGIEVDFDVYINGIQLTGIVPLNRKYKETNINELKEIIKEKLKENNS